MARGRVRATAALYQAGKWDLVRRVVIDLIWTFSRIEPAFGISR
jgi:hypothetical protein